MEVNEANMQALSTYLQQTLSPTLEIRKEAEKFLCSVETQQNFPVLLLRLVSLEVTELSVRVAALSRRPSPIRAATSYLLSLPPGTDMVSLAGGMPAPSTFPFSGVSVDMADGSKYKVAGKDLANALQYGKTEGDAKLLKFWKGLLNKMYAPSRNVERRTLVTNGAELGSYMVLNAIIDPGDSIMMSSPVYSPNILKAEALGANIVEIQEHSELGGVSIESLQSTLEQWPLDKAKPKLLLTCPTGGNPSGTNISAATKQEIYNLACQYNFLILEDDPYCFLDYSGDSPSSFLSIDTEGRVVRFDSLSKVLCPGFRVGFLTAPKQLADICEMHMAADYRSTISVLFQTLGRLTPLPQCSILHTCSLSQAMAVGYFEHVGYEGFIKHAAGLSAYYKAQRDVTIAALDEHMGDLATWIVPQAGMFVWVKINDCSDTSSLSNLAIDNGVCVLPGEAFVTRGCQSQYVRIAFSLIAGEEVDEAIRRLATAVRVFKEYN